MLIHVVLLGGGHLLLSVALTMELQNYGICVKGVPSKHSPIKTRSLPSAFLMHLIRSTLVVLITMLRYGICVKGEVIMTLQGHEDMITGMLLSPDGSYLLTNVMDCKLCIWDMRPYAPQNRCVKVLEGHQHNFEKNLLKCNWPADGSKITTGSSDPIVYIWDTTVPLGTSCISFLITTNLLMSVIFIPKNLLSDLAVVTSRFIYERYEAC